MLPELSFQLNIGALLSPVLLLVLAWLGNSLKKAVIGHMDENAQQARDLAEQRHKENSERIDAILAQTTATNGKVAEHELRLGRAEAKTEVLLELYMKGKPE